MVRHKFNLKKTGKIFKKVLQLREKGDIIMKMLKLTQVNKALGGKNYEEKTNSIVGRLRDDCDVGRLPR